jgi:hypothetical protein
MDRSYYPIFASKNRDYLFPKMENAGVRTNREGRVFFVAIEADSDIVFNPC